MSELEATLFVGFTLLLILLTWLFIRFKNEQFKNVLKSYGERIAILEEKGGRGE